MEILPIAVKFVSWDVSPLDTLKNSRAYMLREKLNVFRISKQPKITRNIQA